MNSLTTYWLCRAPGSDTEGPFTLGQIRKMYDGGAVTVDGQICRNGEEQWTGIDDELAAIELERGPVYEALIPIRTATRETRRVKLGGSSLCALALFAVGIVMVFNPLFSLFGFVAMIAACLVDSKYGADFFCGICGNGIVKTSLQCPHCRASLESPSMGQMFRDLLRRYWVSILTLGCVAAFLIFAKLQS